MDGTLVDTNHANFLSYKKAIHTVAKSDHDVIYNPSNKHQLQRKVTES
jgi:hydroxymethylpyrimidine pyrophosphatase-like HAD family hydrolase